jgi:hypothetical protein
MSELKGCRVWNACSRCSCQLKPAMAEDKEANVP